MNLIFAMFGLAMIARSETDSSRAIGVVMAGAGLNDILREHRDSKGI